MKHIFFITLYLTSSVFFINAQTNFECRLDTIGIPDSLYNLGHLYRSCHDGNSLDLDTCLSYYSNMMQYIPDLDTTKPLHVSPIKTIKLNINIIQKNDGTGNFQDDEEVRNRIRTIMEWINGIYSHYQPSDPISWVTELPNYDSRIRFSIGEYGNERIYFYRNSNWWEPNNVHNNMDSLLTYLINHYPERLENVNVVVFGNNDYNNYHASTTPPSYTNLYKNQYILAYHWFAGADFGIAKLLAHELAHIMGLRHTYHGGGASAICDQSNEEFLKDVFLVSLPDNSNCPHSPNYNADPNEYNGDGITNNLLGGNKSELYISPMQAGQMHRALSLSSARKYVTSEKSEVPLVIRNEQTWDIDMKLYQDLIIESGATLTLTCHLVMHPNTKIIIKPGGKLIIDDATIGTDIYEKNLWPGIQVWGNSSVHQGWVNNGYMQGYLEMKNGATIENALCAVELWDTEHYNSTGGIIHATDAVFKNNAKAVHALYYTNYSPATGLELQYNSIFRNCNFIVDNDYLGTETFNKHVDLDRVDGICFEGCSFSVIPNVTGVSSGCKGIAAYGAGFSVKSYCNNIHVQPCPDDYLVRSSFSGFDAGVFATNNGSIANAFYVTDAVFTMNNIGIYAHNTDFATIKNNEFRIGCNDYCGYGVYADGVTDFCIEENSFQPAPASHGSTYGIGIRNSVGVNDVYLNTFDNLTCGNVSLGVNHTADMTGRPPATILGLTYSCNDNNGNDLDFCVLKDSGVGGIASYQGSSVLPAGNTFGGSQYHFYNSGDYNITYYYNSNDTNEAPNPSKLHCVNHTSTTNVNNCNSHYGGGGGLVKSPYEKAALANDYQSANDAYEELLKLYESQVLSGITPKPELMAQMAGYLHDMNMAAGDIVRSDLFDSIPNRAELRLWLGNMHDLSADRMIVASYIQEGDFNNAFALANTLPDVYRMKDTDLEDHNGYMTLLNLYKTLYNSKRNIQEMTDSERKTVENIAENGVGKSKSMAKSILVEISDRSITYICPDMPRTSRGGQNAETYHGVEENNELVVAVRPTPANTWIAVDYQLPEKSAKATMTIINTLGIKAMELELDGAQYTKSIDLRDMPAGVYSYVVRCGEYTKTGKIVVKK